MVKSWWNQWYANKIVRYCIGNCLHLILLVYLFFTSTTDHYVLDFPLLYNRFYSYFIKLKEIYSYFIFVEKYQNIFKGNKMSIAGVKITYHGISKNPIERYFIFFSRIFFPFQFCWKITNCAIFLWK